MSILIKKHLYKKDVNDIRHDLLNMRFAKAQKKNFSSSQYKKTRKILAQTLTKLNLPSKKEKENIV